MNKKYFFLAIIWSNFCIGNQKTFHNYMWANYTHFAGDISQTQHWYKKLFSASPSIYSYKGYLNFLIDTKQFAQIIELMPQLTEKFSQDPEVQLIFFNALQETKQIKRADELIIKLSQSWKNHPEITLNATQAFLRRQESENALLTINSFLNNTPNRPNNFVFYFLQSHIYVQLNKISLGLESIKKCIELHPHFDKGWLLYASMHEKEGNVQEALSGYTTFLKLSGPNSTIEKHILSLMLKQKAIESNKQFILSRGVNIDNALILFQQKRYPQALAHINACIQQQPDNDECKLLKIQILSAMKDFKQASAIIKLWILEKPENNTWPKTLSLMAYAGMEYKDIIKIFDTILEEQPENFWCNVYCAELYMRHQQNSLSAIPYLEKALVQSKDNNLAAKIAYQLALISYENNDYTKMRTYLEKAHILDANCPHINNTIAYYWATKGKNLEKAHEFIAKALEANKDNPYFLDTFALILYKEKKYTQAQEILEKLVTHNNSTMLLHLAKVHYSLNNKEIADTFTQKAESLIKNNQEKKALEKMKLLLAQK